MLSGRAISQYMVGEIGTVNENFAHVDSADTT